MRLSTDSCRCNEKSIPQHRSIHYLGHFAQMQSPAGISEHTSVFEPSVQGKPSERELYVLWQGYRSTILTGDSGAVTVLDPGYRNRYAGPDFLQALIRFPSGEIRRGAVEIHCCWQDWYIHGHADNPSYAEVILHVVHEGDTPAVRAGEVVQIPTVRMQSEPQSRGNQPCNELIDFCSNAEIESVFLSLARLRWDELCDRAKGKDFNGQLEMLLSAVSLPRRSEVISLRVAPLILELIVNPIFQLNWLDRAVQVQKYLHKGNGSRPQQRYRLPFLVLTGWRLIHEPPKASTPPTHWLNESADMLSELGYSPPGKQFCQEILGNIVLPILAQSRRGLFKDWYNLSTGLYGLTRRRLHRWGIPDQIGFGQQQAILYLDRNWCRLRACSECPLLCQWNDDCFRI